MLKYAYSKEVIENKSANWILQPWIKLGAKAFDSVSQIPNDYILISVHHPPWRSPFKEWIAKGNNYIEVDYGYWGLNNPRRNTRRVTYNSSHNIKIKTVPYSRLHTLNPKISEWRKNRGSNLLIIEPHHEVLFERTGISFQEWQRNTLSMVEPYWNGPIKWRRKAGGKKAGRWESYLEDLEQSHVVIGERTMACVEAVMLGYPAYTIDYSAVSLIMGTELSSIQSPNYPDRTIWLEHIAWSQFLPEEFANGSSVAKMIEQYQINQ